MIVTAVGPPGEEVLDSDEDSPVRKATPGPRRLVGGLVLVVAVVAGLFAFQALQPDPVIDQAEPTTTTTTTTSPADPSLVDASARRLSGDTGIGGAQSFSTAIRAATAVVRQLCRSDIPSWAATLVTSNESYEQATFLMTPANRRYGTFFVQVELTWSVDHYLYAAVAGHVERCV